ncbi:protoporphyrinogen oxidase isoform X4 [Topomyia yanbarensis]|uniref:protoporphyrinogen oxidase isoform X4 n=1 Tax=Topomyia yanbarensis TaxID=2498891 RepID=UPI00273B23D8|nr:protoporphyrinogen oxidase isoform X4 [Topomyia yanbarensis]XP_058813662.1 protoporphyrinogen oxidase isoform X4 [Topomyia yanbarensis]XP_058813663.1 protoporphyrinogen oxidase isoform X4 [Topomyia yanbarensis]
MTAILGAGISGLSAGYYLLRKGRPSPVVILETSNRISGWIRSERFDAEGYVFESGPRTIRPKGPAANNTLDLIEAVGLADQVYPIFSNHVAARNRMIYAKGKLNLLPSDVSGVLKTVPPFTQPLFMAGFKDLFARRSGERLEDETMYSFVERRFGREIADYAVSAMLCGICAGDAKQISVKFLMKRMFEVEQAHGGVIKGFLKEAFIKRAQKDSKLQASSNLAKRAKSENWSMYSLYGGLQTLPNRIGMILKENMVDIRTDVTCEEIVFGDKRIQLIIDGKERVVDRLISSIPSYKLARHVAKQHPALSKELAAIPFVDVAVINIRYKTPNLQKHKAFGFLVPPIENLPILGVIFDSCCFDMEDNTVLTVMMGGAWFEKWFGTSPSEEQLLAVALRQVGEILKINQPPDSYKVNILRKCIPQYVVGHQKRVDGIRQYIREHNLPLGLCGSSYDGVGVNDVIFSATKCVDGLMNECDK